MGNCSVKRLDDILKSAHDLAVTHFNIDLSKGTLDNQDAWEALRAVVRHPVPSTNTFSAKRMRGAAFLAVLGKELSQNVFQPTWFVFGDPFLMWNLANSDPAREAHLRSVLLAAQTDQQHSIGQQCVHKVLGYVQFLVAEEKRQAFKLGLEKVCREACEHWSHLQRLQKVCLPDRLVDVAEDWSVFPWPTDQLQASKGSQVNGNAVNGSAPKSNGQGKQVNGKSHGSLPSSPATPEAPVSSVEDVIHAVWPYFLSDSQTVLKKGWCLTKAQIGEAESEDPATHRGTRRHQRGRAPSVNRNSTGTHMSFLAAGSSGGANGA